MRRMRPSTYQAWDAAVGGKLAEILRSYREDDLSFESIAFRLRTDHSVEVSSSTVYRWMREIKASAA